MEIKIRKKEKDKIIFSIFGETHTFLQLLKYYLLKNKVDYCGYYIDHPSSNEAIFIVKGENLIEKIKNSVEEALNDLNNLRDNLPTIE